MKLNEESNTEEKKDEATKRKRVSPEKPRTDTQEIASQLQAMEAMRMAEEEDEERLRKARIEAGKFAKTSHPSLTENLNNAANSIKEQRPEIHTTVNVSSSSSTLPAKVTTKASIVTTEKEVIEEDKDGVTEALKQAIGADWCELEETMKNSIAKAAQDRFKPY